MRDMRLPPQLRVAIGPSRIARFYVVALAAAVAIVVVTLPLPWIWIVLADASIVAWGIHRSRTFGPGRGPRAVVEISLTADRLIVVRTGNDLLRAGFVRELTYISPSLTAIVWKPDRSRRSQTILLLPDMLSRDDFRRLRVLLRYGRSEDVAGMPASHA